MRASKSIIFDIMGMDIWHTRLPGNEFDYLALIPRLSWLFLAWMHNFTAKRSLGELRAG
jgi:hypothetical protein